MINRPRSSMPSRRRVLNPNAPLAGLANISLGRYMSEAKRNSDVDNDFFDFSRFIKSDFNKSSKKESSSMVYMPEDNIKCHVDIFDDEVILDFSGFVFLGTEFKDGAIAISYRDKASILYINMTGEYVEYKVNNFSEKIKIEGFHYDIIDMVLKNNCVIITV